MRLNLIPSVLLITVVALQAVAGVSPPHDGLSLSNDRRVRMNAFYRFCQTGGREHLLEGVTDRVDLDRDDSETVIDLFRLEAGHMRSSGDLTEEQSSYFADLMIVASKLRDLRTLPVFLEPSVLESGAIAMTGLARLGSAAVGPTLEKLSAVERSSSDDDKFYEQVLLLTLDEMLALKIPMTAADHRKVRSIMVDESHNPDNYLREAALRGLIQVNDAEARQRILELSLTDPWSTRLPAGVAFPIRETASRALQVGGQPKPQNGAQ